MMRLRHNAIAILAEWADGNAVFAKPKRHKENAETPLSERHYVALIGSRARAILPFKHF